MASLIKLKGWDDIKGNILHHLNAEDRREAVLVCKDFYKTICHLERNKSLILDEKVSGFEAK